ncbi:thymidylate synthase [Thermoactinomyces sp. DSM 45891]|uniref:thymidylate synthase n=1 Tax=Thermoactinomyces sp. DSM 45891 TaxID=1761907 RepID=UPI00091AC4E9|nr:thymidylate synthase [Thermoactinomyces sp. DSM 45891]SFX61614.1 thymidylate synthase [Thermoactinomyces sp. DSM 45891]
MLSLQATDSMLNGLKSIDIHASTVDELVKHGITHILDKGDRVSTRAGDALQAYDVNYLLLDSRDRVHTARPQAITYFARELCAYFQGSLKVDSGLSKASKFWNHLADPNGNINSNYGYYVFYQPVPDVKISSQYDWVIKRLCDNRDSRRAIININQGMHKTATKDFPCTVAINYFIREGFLCSKVFSRSTDVITGLPYDMGFFSFLTELVYQDLVDRGIQDLKLGYTMMASNFTQIYDRHAEKALDISDSFVHQESVMMPKITNASEVLEDIYNGTANSEVMKWVYENAT